MGSVLSTENQLLRIHQAASGVFRPIGEFEYHYPSPQLHLTGRSSVACEYLRRTWFLHPEKTGHRKDLLCKFWVRINPKYDAVVSQTIFENSNPFKIIYD